MRAAPFGPRHDRKRIGVGLQNACESYQEKIWALRRRSHAELEDHGCDRFRSVLPR